MPKVVLSHKQFFFMIYVYLIGAGMVFVPEAIFAGRHAWVSVILATIVSMVLMSVWLHLQRKFPGMSPIQYGIKILGPWFGYPMGIWLVYVMFLIMALIIEDLVILTSTVVLPNTPAEIIRLTFIIPAIYACYKGVESIGRMCELAFVPLVILVVAFPILEWMELSFVPLQPILLVDWYGVAIGTVNSLVFPFAEVFVPAMLLPFVSIDKESDKYYHLAILGAGITLIIRTLVTLMVLGTEVLNRMTLPIVAVFRVAEIGVFFNRIEGLFLGIWFIGLLMKLTITMYAGTLGLAQLTGVKRLENLWLPVGVLLFFVSLLRFANIAAFGFFAFYILPFIALPGEVLYPFLLLVVSWLKDRLKPVAVNDFNDRQNKLAQGDGGEEGL